MNLAATIQQLEANIQFNNSSRIKLKKKNGNQQVKSSNKKIKINSISKWLNLNLSCQFKLIKIEGKNFLEGQIFLNSLKPFHHNLISLDLLRLVQIYINNNKRLISINQPKILVLNHHPMTK